MVWCKAKVIGNGKQFILQLDQASGSIQFVRAFDTNDAIFDCTWNEMNENQLATACGKCGGEIWYSVMEMGIERCRACIAFL